MNSLCRNKNHTFVKTFDRVVSQGHQELCGPPEVECQRSASQTCFLHQAEPVSDQSKMSD